MEEYKYIVDMLSSTAALVAIITVLISWYRNAQKPLKVERVVIHRKKSESTYILIVKNRKPYPVSLKSTFCYTKHNYNVEQRKGESPTYSELLNLEDSPFRNTDLFEIGANGHTDVKIKGSNLVGEIPRLLFSIHTTHGYHELWCKNIVVVEMGSAETYELEYRNGFESKYKAKAMYFWLLFRALFKVGN